MRIYDRLPQSLTREGVFLEPTYVQGGELTIEESFRFSLSPLTVGWSFGSTYLKGFDFDSALLKGEYLLGVTAKEEVSEESVSPSLKVKGFFLDEAYRPERLLESEEGEWRPGFSGATLSFISEGRKIDKISFVSPSPVFLDGDELISPSIEVTVNDYEVTFFFPDEATVVSALSLTFLEEEVSERSIRASFFIQPVGRPVQGGRYDETLNLYLLNYSQTKGFTVVNDLRTKGDDPDYTKALTAFWDETLDEHFRLRETYVPRFMNPYTAYKEYYDL